MIGTRWRRDAAIFSAFAALLALSHRPLFLGKVIAGVDAFQLAIPDATFLLDCLRHGEWPLWTPYERLGQPFAGQLQTQAFYLPRLLSVVIAGPVLGITLEQLFHATISCIGTFLACRSLGRSHWASFVAAAAFALGPLSTELANVPNMAGAAAWSGAMLAASRYLDKTRSPRAIALLACTAAASLLAGSPETLLWQIAVVVVAGAPGGLRTLGRQGGALLLAGLLAAITVLPTLEFLRHSVRLESVPGQFDWSAPVPSLLALFWLNADLPRPGGEQHLVACLFQGTVMSALALASLRQKGESRRLLLLGAVLALLALGDQFLPSHLLLSVPPLSLFRYPVKYLVGASFCLSIAAAGGLDELQRLNAPSWRRAVLWTAVIIALLFGVRLLLPLLPVRGGALAGLGWGGGFLITALLLLSVPRGNERASQVALGLGGLALAELAMVSFLWGTPMWLPQEDVERPSMLRSILPSPTAGRVSVEVTNDQRLAVWPNAETVAQRSRDNRFPLRNVEEGVAIAEGYGPPEPREYSKAFSAARRGLFDLAGVDLYLRSGGPPFEGLTRIQTTSDLTVYRSRSALPRAYLAQRSRVAMDEEALAALADPAEPFRDTLLLASGEALSPDCKSPAPIWREYRTTSLALDVAPCAPAWLVVTDTFFPGWTAEVDGAQVEIHRANLLVRAVRVPPGKHTVRMVYRPISFVVGAFLSLLGVLITLGLVAFRRTP